MPNECGTLFIVATPIGNLGDLSERARETLANADLVLAEDTRRTRVLLDHLGVRTRMETLHEHNERDRAPRLIEQLQAGQNLALVSDAGTPLISDPGYPLVAAVRAAGIPVVPVPGACALITALSVAGLPTDRFVFEGFLPAKSGPRRKRLERLAQETRTLVFYEAPHRAVETLADLRAVFGDGREAVVARELTKRFETVRGDTLAALQQWVEGDPEQQLGEFVLVVAGAPPRDQDEVDSELERMMGLLLEELPLKQAAAIAARLTGAKKNRAYQIGLALKE